VETVFVLLVNFLMALSARSHLRFLLAGYMFFNAGYSAMTAHTIIIAVSRFIKIILVHNSTMATQTFDIITGISNTS